jgi:hypothetical protein
VVIHTGDGHSVDEMAFLMQASPSLVRAYQALYEQYDTPEYQERIEEIIATVKLRGFRPNQLANSSEPARAEKGGGGAMSKFKEHYRELQYHPEAAKSLRRILYGFIRREFSRLGGSWVRTTRRRQRIAASWTSLGSTSPRFSGG